MFVEITGKELREEVFLVPPPPPPPPFSNTSVLFKPRSQVYGLQHVDLGLH